MKKVEIIADHTSLDIFLKRKDITIIQADVKSCEQSSFAQYSFIAVFFYRKANFLEKLCRKFFDEN